MSDETTERARAIMRADFDDVTRWSRYCAESMFDYMLKKCESPIEVLMLGALSYGLDRCCDSRQRQFPSYTLKAARAEGVHLRAQEAIGPYRVDFALSYTLEHAPGLICTVNAVIECDGHDFHNRTKEQAQRDRERDRYLQQCGWAVLRFTGSEIVRDPRACADQVADFLASESHRLIDDRLEDAEAV